MAFDAGLNVITGETGAGKSLLISAISLALGERADKRVIRADTEQCVVEAVFHLDRPAKINQALNEIGLPESTAGEIVLRRILTSAGPSRQFVNDSPVTLQALQKIGSLLADMHGPHEHQSLLNHKTQLEMLDAYGCLQKPFDSYQKAYLLYESLLAELKQQEGTAAQPAEWLEALVEELTLADLKETEETELLADQKLLGNAQRVQELAQQTAQFLTESEYSALNTITAARKALVTLAGLIDNSDWVAELDSVQLRLRELAGEITYFAERAEHDPERLALLEQRLLLYQKMKHKYGGTVAAALEKLREAQAELERVKFRAQRLRELKEKLSQAQAEVIAIGTQLSRARHKAGEKLAKFVTAELKTLDMPTAVFEVHLTETEPGPAGLDQIEFGFTANLGEISQDLKKVASSGEISRVMLAVKSVLAEQDDIPLLVFDEIDVNLGGHAAGVVGSKLRELARYHQILCITHLPQVASAGHSHTAVSKAAVDQRIVTKVTRIDETARIDEIARMLGGSNITPVTLKHAREMLSLPDNPS